MQTATQRPKVAVIGAGYWGRNLVRNFFHLNALEIVCDNREEVLSQIRTDYPVRTTRHVEDVLQDSNIDATVISVPAALHYEVARKALLSGKDVYVEKPLALHRAEGGELVELAAREKRILMVGHILEYHPAILALKRMIKDGELGKIQYIYSSRLNLGKLRTEENILWSFAPHDISAILFLLDEMPSHVSSHGGSYLNSGIMDVTLTTCHFESGVNAHIFVSWLHPVKEQKFTVVGDRKMAVFDDTGKTDKLVLYPHRINWIDRSPVAQKEIGQSIPLPDIEPLRAECEHFLESVRTRHAPRTDGASALRVLGVLEASENSTRQFGAPVRVAQKNDFEAHSTAVIDAGCEIGAGTRVWHFSHIMSGAIIGRNCNIGQNVVISPHVRIGNNVKIQNNVSVYTGVELEDDVFCGPSMVFTNVINPRSHISRKHEYRRTLVRQGASIGANATIVCGVTLGRFCFIGAGAVVRRDVPDYALMVGVPARRISWICHCGIRLPDKGSNLICSGCGKRYMVANEICSEMTPAEYVPLAVPVSTDD